jgi:hypothetical protein
MTTSIRKHAAALAREAVTATAASSNESTLRHELEKCLEAHCGKLEIPYTPYTLDLALTTQDGKSHRFADVVHGAVVIEYEPPRSFGGIEGATLAHAKGQAEDYTRLIQQEEGRPLSEYVLVAWDGSHITFGKYDDDVATWGRLTGFGVTAANRLLRHLRQDGIPLVHPKLLCALVGPESDLGHRLIPLLFRAVLDSAGPRSQVTTKTKLLFTEWRRLFGQVVGVQSDRLKDLLEPLHQNLWAAFGSGKPPSVW